MAVDYELLTADTVAGYVAGQPHLASRVDPATLEVAEVGDGNLNLVFVCHDADGRGICLKQSLPYVRLVGEGWPLTPERVEAETRGLKAACAVVPHLAPEFYGLDLGRNVLAMEYLQGWGMWRAQLNEGLGFAGVPAAIGEYVAAVTMSTSLFGVADEAFKAAQAAAINPELCKITEDLVFTEPYIDHERNSFTPGIAGAVAALRSDARVVANAGALKWSFMTTTEALIHGDLHTGSVMVRHTGPVTDGIGPAECRVIDAEFCFYGPVAFDVGAVMGNYLAARARAEVLGRPAAFTAWLDGAATETWLAFCDGVRSRWDAQRSPVWSDEFREQWLAKVGREAIGFAGCKAIRRIVGLAKVSDIETLPPEEHDVAARMVLRTAARWIADAAELGDPTAMMAVFDEERRAFR